MRVSHIVTSMAALLAILGSCQMAAAEPCAGAITVTGRNELLKVSESDRRALFYHQVCKAESSDTGITFEYAKVALGFSHSNKQQYCEAEESQWAAYQFDYFRTSTVVEAALDSWLACIRLTRSGILLTPKIEPTRLILTLERASKAKGIIRGVSSTAGTTCKGHLPNRKNSGTQSQVLTDSISYQLPVDEAWAVICDRQPRASSIQVGAMVYPETTITIDTTEGGFSITLDEAPLGSEKWANSISSEISELKKQHQLLLDRSVKECRLCFKETEGSVACEKSRDSCSSWSPSGSDWTAPFRDETDDRDGGCTYQWRVECR